MTVQFSAIIDGVTAKKDGTLSVKLGTQELPKDNMASLFSYANHQIWVALSDVPINHEDLDIPEKLIEATDKSYSQRLRSVLYVLWQNGDKKIDADTHYRQQMEKIIEYIKEKLP